MINILWYILTKKPEPKYNQAFSSNFQFTGQIGD